MRVLLVGWIVVGVGCAKSSKALRRQAAMDLSCTESQVKVSTLNKAGATALYLAEGCGRQAQYQVTKHGGAVRVTEIGGAMPGGEGGGTASAGEEPPPPPPPPAP